MKKMIRDIVVVAALSAFPIYGQTATGRIVGTVTDPSGAVIPNAAITVVDEKTGQERGLEADTAGYYVGANLAPSTYKLTAKGSGLGPTEISGVPLAVGTERHVNIVVAPPTQTTEITVASGELAQVDTSSAAVGTNVNAREVATLP